MRIPHLPIWIKTIIIAVVTVLLVNVFALTLCTIPFGGMENSIYPGEKVLINKWSYGFRVPFSEKRLFPELIRRGDVVLFNNPNPSESTIPVYNRPLYISRCVGIPGDTLMLNDEMLVTSDKIPTPDAKSLYSYPKSYEDTIMVLMNKIGITNNRLAGYKDSSYIRSFSHYEYYLLKQQLPKFFPLEPLYKQNEEKGGHPFVIPSRGKSITVYPWNVNLLCNTIIYHENRVAFVRNDSLFVDGNHVKSYKFGKDYYWMASNNPLNMSDSRLFGFVPEDHIIGKAICILFSDKRERLFKRVE